MSAYVCNPEHFGVLAAYAVQTGCVISAWNANKANSLLARITNAQEVAKGLARENIRSVAHRYPEDSDGDRPGPRLLDAEIEEAAALYAAHFITNPQRLAPVQVIKLVRSLDYQSCETDDWKDTLAWQQLDWITGRAVSALPGYDDTDWSFKQTLPEVDALYQRV